MEVKVVLIYSEENGLLLLFISKFDRKECFSNDASIVTVFQDNTIVVMCSNKLLRMLAVGIFAEEAP